MITTTITDKVLSFEEGKNISEVTAELYNTLFDDLFNGSYLLDGNLRCANSFCISNSNDFDFLNILNTDALDEETEGKLTRFYLISFLKEEFKLYFNFVNMVYDSFKLLKKSYILNNIVHQSLLKYEIPKRSEFSEFIKENHSINISDEEHLLVLHTYHTLFRVVIYTINLDHFPNQNVGRERLVLIQQCIKTIEFLPYIEDLPDNIKDNVKDVSAKILSRIKLLKIKYDIREVQEFYEKNRAAQGGYDYKLEIVVTNSENKQTNFDAVKLYESDNRRELQFLLERTCDFYEINPNWKSKIKSTVYNLDSHSNIHFSIKKYKDIEKIVGRIAELENKIIWYRSSNNSNYQILNSYIKKVNLSYLYNNLFSAYIEQPKLSIKEVYSKYLELSVKLQDLEVENYFIPGKFCSFIANRLDEIKGQERIDSIAYSQLLDELESVDLESVMRNYWINNKKFEDRQQYLYIIPPNDKIFTESKIGYFYSSYMLHLTSNTLSGFSDVISRLQIEIPNLSAAKQTKKMLAEMQELSNSINKKEAQTLQIVTIVAGLMTFVASSVKGFEFIDSYDKFIFFALAFGAGIAAFTMIVIQHINVLINPSIVLPRKKGMCRHNINTNVHVCSKCEIEFNPTKSVFSFLIRNVVSIFLIIITIAGFVLVFQNRGTIEKWGKSERDAKEIDKFSIEIKKNSVKDSL